MSTRSAKARRVPRSAGLFRWCGGLPPRHSHAVRLVRELSAGIPRSAMAPAWAQAFAGFLQAETHAERQAARANIHALHAATFRVPLDVLLEV